MHVTIQLLFRDSFCEGAKNPRTPPSEKLVLLWNALLRVCCPVSLLRKQQEELWQPENRYAQLHTELLPLDS